MKLKDKKLFRQQCYVDGKWIDADSKETIKVNNPADNSTLGTVPKMGGAETRRAIEAANKAWPAWRAKTGKERAAILRRFFDLMVANADDLALIMTMEQGKPLAEAKGEVVYAASFLEWFGEEAKRVYGDTIPQNVPGTPHRRHQGADRRRRRDHAVEFPVRHDHPQGGAGAGRRLHRGVPSPRPRRRSRRWRWPSWPSARACPPACSTSSPARPRHQARELTSNPIVRKLSFTGSTEIGKLLMEQCAGTVKKMSLELGGNAPFIVFDDADLDAAVEGAIASKYRNTGQTCVCANRLLVQDGVYDAFTKRLIAAVRKLKVGPGWEDGVTQGPLIDLKAVEKVEEHIADAVAKGAKVLLGGKRHALGGTFFEPTVVADVTPKMAVAREETFGPMAPIFRFKTEKEAIEMANDTEFGLAAYFYARDIGRVWRVAEGLEYGIVGINEGIISTEVAPFGGVKELGIGREGSHYGIDEFVEVKYMCMGGIGA